MFCLLNKRKYSFFHNNMESRFKVILKRFLLVTLCRPSHPVHLLLIARLTYTSGLHTGMGGRKV